jgi:hypothetical protein
MLAVLLGLALMLAVLLALPLSVALPELDLVAD